MTDKNKENDQSAAHKAELATAPCSLILGDCLEMMKHLPDGSVDMVMCDLPY